MIKKLVARSFTRLLCFVALASASIAVAQSVDDVPDAPREMRGVWVATLTNIDWPSSKGLSADDQKLEIVSLFDRFAELNLNCVFLQVRATCDSLYKSDLEPWSASLTGRPGGDPNYDPLEFACEEAHKRGMLLYAWVNPYRAATASSNPVADNHVTKAKPELVKQYGTKLWLDPGKEEAQQHSLNVFKDIVTRYNIDGVVFDDYFYPYLEKGPDGRVIDFPDDDTYGAYKEKGGTLSKADWRRDNVNKFVHASYDELHAIKPKLVFGIGPFGIWRPGNPPGVSGMDSFNDLFADSKKWLNEGWVDFIAPQLYWTSDSNQSYPALLKWWASENTKKRMVWASNFTSKANAGGAWSADEIVKQVQTTREQPGASGNVHYSARPLRDNHDNIVSKLVENVYSGEALPPAFRWLDSKAPESPKATAKADAAAVTVSFENESDDVFLHTVYTKNGGQWQMAIVPKGQKDFKVPGTAGLPDVVAVKAVDSLGNESDPTIVYPASGAATGQ